MCMHVHIWRVKLLDVSGGLDKEGRWKDTRYNTFNCSLNDDNIITWLQPGYSFDGPLSNCELDSSHSLLCLPSQPKHSSYVHVSPTAIWPLTWWPPTWMTTQQSPTHFGHLMSKTQQLTSWSLTIDSRVVYSSAVFVSALNSSAVLQLHCLCSYKTVLNVYSY